MSIITPISFRPFDKNDLEIRTKWLQNPSVGVFLGWQIRKGTTLAEQQDWYEGYNNDDNDKRFIIEIDGRAIGIVGLTDINPVDKNALLYILIGDDEFRGKGIGKIACDFILNFGFEELALHKIFLEVNSYNNHAVELYHKLGFCDEGRLIDKVFCDGKYQDEIYMGLSKKKYLQKDN